MSNTIADSLGVEVNEKKELVKTKNTVDQVPSTQDKFTKTLIENRMKDYSSARNNILNLLSEVEGVIGDAVLEVKRNPSARMIEVFSNLARTFSEINKDLIDISGPIDRSVTKIPEKESSPVNNIVFVGTSDSLIDTIKANMR